MALQNKIAHLFCKSLQTEMLKMQLSVVGRRLHKSAASESMPMTSSGEQALPDGLITPTPVEIGKEAAGIKSLKEMPGPSAIGNLVEFFYRDGFSRIHEIQVSLLFLHFRVKLRLLYLNSGMAHWYQPTL